jgi:hypothetical protein
MCGWTHVGYIVDGGKVRYTDWGQLGVELALGVKGEKGYKIDLCCHMILQKLHKAIDKDIKGEISIQKYQELVSDANYLIIANHLFTMKHGDWVRH